MKGMYHSYIRDYIKESGVSWNDKDGLKALFEEKGITVKFSEDYTIFTYAIEADFSDPIVREARGIIFKGDKIMCHPFNKFGNFSESYADTDILDWKSAAVQTKIDGSLIKLWYDDDKNEWVFSTNGMVFANEASASCDISFMDVIKSTKEYEKLISWTKSASDKEKENCYMMELVSPYTQIVVKYSEPKLYHIGTRNLITGEEEKPVEFKAFMENPSEHWEIGENFSLDSCIELVKTLNKEVGKVDFEGFVVVDNQFHRVKVKSPEYILNHRILAGDRNKGDFYALLEKPDFDSDAYCREYPLYEPYIRFYQYALSSLIAEIKTFIIYTRGLYEENSNERKAVAMQIKEHPLSAYGFMGLDKINDTPEKILDDILFDDMLKSRLFKLIPEYQSVISLLNKR